MFEYVAGKNSFAVPTDGMWQKIGFGKSFLGGEPYLLFGPVSKREKWEPFNTMFETLIIIKIIHQILNWRYCLLMLKGGKVGSEKKCLHNWAILMKGALWILSPIRNNIQ